MDSDNRGLGHPLDRVIRPCGRYRLDLRQRGLPPLRDPRKLISDNGTQFISVIMQKICFCLGISQAFTPVYHPEANPVERRNRDLKTRLAIQIRDKPHSDWPRQLSSIRFAMNTARSQSTGKTTAFLLFGSEIRSIDDVTNDLHGVVLFENFVAEATPRLLRLHES
jgi:transposase InsO family protein